MRCLLSPSFPTHFLAWCSGTYMEIWKNMKHAKLSGLSPRANYTDQATAAFADIEVRGQSGGFPTALISGFLDRSRYFFFQVAPEFYSRG
jgi:hypothetical protein